MGGQHWRVITWQPGIVMIIVYFAIIVNYLVNKLSLCLWLFEVYNYLDNTMDRIMRQNISRWQRVRLSIIWLITVNSYFISRSLMTDDISAKSTVSTTVLSNSTAIAVHDTSDSVTWFGPLNERYFDRSGSQSLHPQSAVIAVNETTINKCKID